MKLLKSALLASALALPICGAAVAETPANALIVAQNIDDIVAIERMDRVIAAAGQNKSVFF